MHRRPVVADRLARMRGPDLRIRAAGALRAVLGGVMAEREAEMDIIVVDTAASGRPL